MQKLELTWIGKGQEPAVEPRILLHDPSRDYGDPDSENMLIHGDNLLALKALEQQFAGKVKCIYIDPPYNIDAMNEHYDDYIEHSQWLNRMLPRLRVLRNLLSEDGTIWIQISDEEQAYLKVLCDEVFGRSNFINMISVNMKNIAGASGGGEDKRLKKNCEYILIYSKNHLVMPAFKSAYDYVEIGKLVESYRENGISWKYTSVLVEEGKKEYLATAFDGQGAEIVIFERKGAVIKSVAQLSSEMGIPEEEVFRIFGKRIFQTEMPQSSIRPRVMEKLLEIDYTCQFISIEYTPRSGRNKGYVYEQFYKGSNCRLLAWLSDVSEEIDGKLYKKILQGTYWDCTAGTKNLTKEGEVSFPNGKKPEIVVQRIIEMSTEIGDLVLDSFLGSGTTAAVAHKLGRRWIGIELGEHCYTHCIPRLLKVVDGEQGGISQSVGWQGGGGFKFYELAPTLIVKDHYGNQLIDAERYSPEMLAAAVAKLNGYYYAPDATIFWKQGRSQESSYIFTTTTYLSARQLDEIAREVSPAETLLICCPAFDNGLNTRYDNITIKKIPQSVLDKCEYGKDHYDLNIIDVPEPDEGDEEVDDE